MNHAARNKVTRIIETCMLLTRRFMDYARNRNKRNNNARNNETRGSVTLGTRETSLSFSQLFVLSYDHL